MKRFLAGAVFVSFLTIAIVVTAAAPTGQVGSAQYYDTLDPVAQFGFFQGVFFTITGIPGSAQDFAAFNRCIARHGDLTLEKLFQAGTLYNRSHPELWKLNAPSALAKGLTAVLCPGS